MFAQFTFSVCKLSYHIPGKNMITPRMMIAQTKMIPNRSTPIHQKSSHWRTLKRRSPKKAFGCHHFAVLRLQCMGNSVNIDSSKIKNGKMFYLCSGFYIVVEAYNLWMYCYIKAVIHMYASMHCIYVSQYIWSIGVFIWVYSYWAYPLISRTCFTQWLIPNSLKYLHWISN